MSEDRTQNLPNDDLRQILAQLTLINSRLDRVDSRLDSMDARLEKMDARLEKVEDKFDAVGAELLDMRTDIGRVKKRLPAA